MKAFQGKCNNYNTWPTCAIKDKWLWKTKKFVFFCKLPSPKYFAKISIKYLKTGIEFTSDEIIKYIFRIFIFLQHGVKVYIKIGMY